MEDKISSNYYWHKISIDLMGLLPEKYLVPIEKMIDDGKIQLDFYDILGEVAKLP